MGGNFSEGPVSVWRGLRRMARPTGGHSKRRKSAPGRRIEHGVVPVWVESDWSPQKRADLRLRSDGVYDCIRQRCSGDPGV